MVDTHLIADLLAFMNERRTIGSTERLLELVSPPDLRGVAGSILEWLKMQHRYHTDRPMSVPLRSNPATTIAMLAGNCSDFREVFVFEIGTAEATLDFQETVPFVLREQMRLLAQQFQPPLMRKAT